MVICSGFVLAQADTMFGRKDIWDVIAAAVRIINAHRRFPMALPHATPDSFAVYPQLAISKILKTYPTLFPTDKSWPSADASYQVGYNE